MTHEILTGTLLLHTISEALLPYLVLSFLALAVAGLLFHGYTLLASREDLRIIRDGLRNGKFIHSHLIVAEYHVLKARSSVISQLSFITVALLVILIDSPRGADIVFAMHLLFILIIALILYNGILDNIERRRLLQEDIDEEIRKVTEE